MLQQAQEWHIATLKKDCQYQGLHVSEERKHAYNKIVNSKKKKSYATAVPILLPETVPSSETKVKIPNLRVSAVYKLEVMMWMITGGSKICTSIELSQKSITLYRVGTLPFV